MSFVCSFECPS